MGRLTESLNALLAGFGLALEPWMASVAAVAIAILLMPALRMNFKTKQARKRMLRAAHARVEERDALHAEALALVHGNPVGQLVVAEEALKRGHRAVAMEAAGMLGRSGKRRDDHRRLMLKLEDKRPSHPEVEALAIERLLERGEREQAAERLAAARARWPKAEALAALRVDP